MQRKDHAVHHASRTVRASAPGKAILCGEHAVVYGQPAIALPIMAASATATVRTADKAGITIRLPDINQRLRRNRPTEHPLMVLARRTLERIGITSPTLDVKLQSTIPIASGMGSGAALGAALVRGLAAYYERPLDPATVSALVYESERFFHGTPSGIDNTVVSFAQPVWYRRDSAGGSSQLEALHIGAACDFIIGNTGVRAPTRLTVAGVRERWTAEPRTYERHFERIGQLTAAARDALRVGDIVKLGELLNEDQTTLEQIGVSSPELNRLVQAARDAGALGAKLSGGGGGGIMLALVTPASSAAVGAALTAAGAVRVIQTTLAPSLNASTLRENPR